LSKETGFLISFKK